MARKPNTQKLQSIYHEIRENPGRRPGFIARLLGLPRSQVTRSLPALEAGGYLLSEDERGGLWPYDHKWPFDHKWPLRQRNENS